MCLWEGEGEGGGGGGADEDENGEHTNISKGKYKHVINSFSQPIKFS